MKEREDVILAKTAKDRFACVARVSLGSGLRCFSLVAFWLVKSEIGVSSMM